MKLSQSAISKIILGLAFLIAFSLGYGIIYSPFKFLKSDGSIDPRMLERTIQDIYNRKCDRIRNDGIDISTYAFTVWDKSGNDIFNTNSGNIRFLYGSYLGGIYFSGSQNIGNNYNYSGDDGELSINSVGYLAGTTKFRDLGIYDGKGNYIVFLDGSDKSAGFYGSLFTIGSGTGVFRDGSFFVQQNTKLKLALRADQTFATGIESTVKFDYLCPGTTDYYSEFNVTTSSFIAKFTGHYLISVQLSGAALTAGTYWNFGLYVNGSVGNQTGGNTWTGTESKCQMVDDIFLNAGDKVMIRASYTDALTATANLYSFVAGTHCTLTITRLP